MGVSSNCLPSSLILPSSESLRIAAFLDFCGPTSQGDPTSLLQPLSSSSSPRLPGTAFFPASPVSIFPFLYPSPCPLLCLCVPSLWPWPLSACPLPSTHTWLRPQESVPGGGLQEELPSFPCPPPPLGRSRAGVLGRGEDRAPEKLEGCRLSGYTARRAGHPPSPARARPLPGSP